MNRKILTAVLLLFPSAAVAQPLEHSLKLSWPLACKPNTECFISSYPDLQVGTNPTAPHEYRCGSRTKSGFKGVEFSFNSYQTALDNQKVLAAAPGRVVYVKNDLADGATGREVRRHPCGNEVRVLHSSGYQTRYCHLRQGSALVYPGQAVTAGHALGMVGYSGEVQHPRLVMYTEQDGHLLDPFTGRALNAPNDCFSSRDRSLWSPDVAYPDVLVMDAAFSNYLPTQEDIDNGVSKVEQVSRDSHHLVAWVHVFGLKRNDHEVLEIRDPTGKLWKDLNRYSQFDSRDWLTFVQGARAEKPFSKGKWTAAYRLTRDGQVLVERTMELQVK